MTSVVVIPARRPRRPGRALLAIAGALTIELAILHLAVIRYGARAYEYFGAPQLAVLVEQGSRTPMLITLGLVVVFVVLALYAFSGAAMIPRLPLLRPVIVATSAVFLMRGHAFIPELWIRLEGPEFPWRYVVFSGVSLFIGIVWAVGTIRSWSRLSRR